MQAQTSAPPLQPTGQQYDCVCIKYGFGRLHKVSHVAWKQHLANASSEEERQRIRTARLLGERITSLPPLPEPLSPPDRNHFVPPSVRRAEARRGLAKRAREDRDPNEYVGHRKHVRKKQSNDPNQTDVPSGNANEPAVLLCHTEGELGIPNPQIDTSLVDWFDADDCDDYPVEYLSPPPPEHMDPALLDPETHGRPLRPTPDCTEHAPPGQPDERLLHPSSEPASSALDEPDIPPPPPSPNRMDQVLESL
ncbi:hypothetical protein EDD15DRAFT_2368278 [Pisolithus albus]|nr:hypothetical protein EDD15DRAFT_2368278 [Pisolithus albus]